MVSGANCKFLLGILTSMIISAIAYPHIVDSTINAEDGLTIVRLKRQAITPPPGMLGNNNLPPLSGSNSLPPNLPSTLGNNPPSSSSLPGTLPNNLGSPTQAQTQPINSIPSTLPASTGALAPIKFPTNAPPINSAVPLPANQSPALPIQPASG